MYFRGKFRLRKRTDPKYLFIIPAFFFSLYAFHAVQVQEHDTKNIQQDTVLKFNGDATKERTNSYQSEFRYRSLLGTNSNNASFSNSSGSNNVQSTKEAGVYPEDIFSIEDRKRGAVILHIFGVCYMFLALAIACDEFFVPSLEVIIEKFNLPDDVAGATFMAAGGSAPELFTSIIGVFFAHSNVGFGTIVGSAVFNVLFVIGMCAVFSRGVLHLTWWPLFRDCCFYSGGLVCLILFFRDGKMEWHESLILLGCYVLYVTFMAYNHDFERWIKGKLKSNKISDGKLKKDSEKYDLETGENCQRGDMNHIHKALDYVCSIETGNKSCFRFGTIQLLIHTMDPLGDAPVSVKYKRLQEMMAMKFQMENEKENCQNGNTAAVTMTTATISQENTRNPSQINVQSGKSPQSDNKPVDDEGNDTSNIVFNDADMMLQTVDGAFDNHSQSGSSQPGSKKGSTYAISVDEKQANSDDLIPAVKTLPDLGEDSGFSGSNTEANNQNIVIIDKGNPLQHPSSSKQMLIEDASSMEDDFNDVNEPLDLSWPDNYKDRIFYIIRFPIIICLHITLSDVRKPEKRNRFAWTFFASILWIGGFSYLMVWWANQVGEAMSIEPEVMGLTFLAAGTSIPDLITSVLVARKGLGDMAVSSSIGSNMFDITVGLPVPWLIWSAINGGQSMVVVSKGLFCSCLLLFIMLIFIVITIMICGWRMTKTLGAVMFFLYIIFLTISLLIQDDILTCQF